MTFSAEQLAERRKFIGASEASAALGLSPFFSQVELYLDKIGQGEPIETTIPMMVGTALEPVVLELFEKDSGLTVGDRQRVLYDESTPWRRCTVDGIASDGWLVEAKTSGDFRGWGDEDDAIPQHYLFNAMHSLKCAPGAPGIYFPVLVGGRTYRTYLVERNSEADEMIDLVCRGEEQFIGHVLQRKPPEPRSVEDCRQLYPTSVNQSVVADAAIEQAATEVAKLKKQSKAIDAEIDLLLTKVLSFMGPYSTLRRLSLIGAQGAELATWNSTSSERIDVGALRTLYPKVAAAVTKVSSSRRYLNKIKV